MNRCRTLVIMVLFLLGAAALTFAQTAGHDALAAQLTKEESLLSSDAVITPQDLTRIAKLADEIKAGGFKDLATRAAIVLSLARDREQSKAKLDALSAEIRSQVAAMHRQQGQGIRDGIAGAGFWTGVVGAGTGVLAASMSSWAFNEFYNATVPQTAQNYFLTGKITNLVAVSSIAAAALGFGVAGIELFGLYNAPVPVAGPIAVPYPADNMTKEAKIAFLQKTLTDYSREYARASRARAAGTTSFVAGLIALSATAILLNAADNEFQLYNSANFSVDATTLRSQVTILQWIAVGTGGLAAVGLGGGIATYFLVPDPEQLQSDSANVESQLRAVEGEP